MKAGDFMENIPIWEKYAITPEEGSSVSQNPLALAMGSTSNIKYQTKKTYIILVNRG